MLRVRLVLWYSLLTVITIAGVGLFQYFLLYSSLTTELDTSLAQDARTTLRLLPSRPRIDTLTRGRSTKAKTIRELMDDALENAPPGATSDELTDLVMTEVMDEMLLELSGEKSLTVDAVEATVQRAVTDKRNNLIEIYLLTPYNTSLAHSSLIYRSPGLARDTLRRLLHVNYVTESDSLRYLGEVDYEPEALRAVVSSNERYAVFVAYPETDIHDAILRLLTTYAFIVPIALVIAAVGGIILAGKALKPIEEIADAAREISAKNLSRRIVFPERTDRELMTLVATLNSMFSRLEISYEQIAQFSSDASHELKTPLAIMKGEIEQTNREITSDRNVSEEELKGLMTSLMEEVERMQRIVEGLLLIAKAEDRKLPLEKQMTNIHDFLTEIGEDTEILASAKGLQFISRLAPDTIDIQIEMDRTKIYQVMMNLVDNALKYTQQGIISIFLEKDIDAVNFGVEDTGPGIPPEDIAKVFQRFFRSESSRAHTSPEHVARSLGLGLAITKSIVEAHGGTITVQSKLNEGTKFRVTLPLQAS
jgi:signal transduction histidine kinase